MWLLVYLLQRALGTGELALFVSQTPFSSLAVVQWMTTTNKISLGCVFIGRECYHRDRELVRQMRPSGYMYAQPCIHSKPVTKLKPVGCYTPQARKSIIWCMEGGSTHFYTVITILQLSKRCDNAKRKTSLPQYHECEAYQKTRSLQRRHTPHTISNLTVCYPCILQGLNVCGMQCTSYYIGYLHYISWV